MLEPVDGAEVSREEVTYEFGEMRSLQNVDGELLSEIVKKKEAKVASGGITTYGGRDSVIDDPKPLGEAGRMTAAKGEETTKRKIKIRYIVLGFFVLLFFVGYLSFAFTRYSEVTTYFPWRETFTGIPLPRVLF